MSVVGVAGEDRTDYTKEEARHIRQRSRRLLRQLLRGHVGTITAIAIMLIISVGTQVAGPSVIAYGIDHVGAAVVRH